MTGGADPDDALIAGFRPETTLERKLVGDPELRAGLAWGTPRPGHPEGAVGAHVADLIRRIDAGTEIGERRQQLRVAALVHDSFKYAVDAAKPKRGENHHAMRARRFAERLFRDEAVLSTIELHDRPYAIWRRLRRKGHLDEPAFLDMMARIPDPDLFLRFVELDGSTEGKREEPLVWFRRELDRRGRGAA